VAYLTKRELARRLGVSATTVENMVRDGRLPAADLVLGPNCIRWSAERVDAHLEQWQRQRQSANPADAPTRPARRRRRRRPPSP
jgi:excisionase family DNA binding protein